MPSKCCKTTHTIQFLLIASACLFCCISSVAVSQDFAPPANKNNQPRQGVDQTSFRPPLMETKTSRPAKVAGSTFVGLEPGLGRLLMGEQPRTKIELISLDKQQTKVAEKINLVTVNLQHGSTQGSGVIITGEGYILTAAHVAGRPKQKISIIMHDGERVEGVSMGSNKNMDAGLVRITKTRDTATEPWPHATLGSSSDLKLGQWCIATGHPGGWMPDRPAVVRIGRLLRIIPSTLVTDCSLIGGDSGGPLFDLEGRLIGIHSRIGVEVDDNMHVPVDVFDESWSLLVENKTWGSLPGFKPAIGVIGATEIGSENICKIARVERKGPADMAGIQAGDIILKFDNQPIQNFDQLKAAVDSVTPGEQVIVELQRDGTRFSKRLIVGIK